MLEMQLRIVHDMHLLWFGGSPIFNVRNWHFKSNDATGFTNAKTLGVNLAKKCPKHITYIYIYNTVIMYLFIFN